MARYLFSSHDGFGVGHARRNTLIARAVLAREPDAEIGIITGLAVRPSWLGDPRMQVIHVPGLVKDSGGSYHNDALSFEEALERRAAVLVAGPYATHQSLESLAPDPSTRGRLRLVRDVAGCAGLFARAARVVQMAGYNSTFEALAAGIRPVLVPRRSPRREQAIRAGRLASLGLADVVDERVPAAEVAWLLGRPRLLPAGALEQAGIALDGHLRAAEAVTALAGVVVR
jgi:predicted glycosyltransferase